MDKELMFIIENKELYLEREIVTLDIPLLFVCIDNSHQRYLCLCTDSDELSYLVAESKDKNIINLLESTIPMKDAFKLCDKIWRIITQDNIIEDEINKVIYDDIPSIDLPQDGATLGFTNPYLDEYKEIIKQELEEYQTSFEIYRRIALFKCSRRSIKLKSMNNNTHLIESYSQNKENYYSFNTTISV